MVPADWRDALIVDCFIDRRRQTWFDFEIIPVPPGRDVVAPLILAGCVFGVSLVFEGQVFTDGDDKPQLYQSLDIWACGLVANAGFHSACAKPIILEASVTDSPKDVEDELISDTMSRVNPGVVLTYKQSCIEDLEITRESLRQTTAEMGILRKRRLEAVALMKAADAELERSIKLLIEVNIQLKTLKQGRYHRRNAEGEYDEGAEDRAYICWSCYWICSVEASHQGAQTMRRPRYCPVCGEPQIDI